jgi:hypothetical protein
MRWSAPFTTAHGMAPDLDIAAPLTVPLALATLLHGLAHYFAHRTVAA